MTAGSTVITISDVEELGVEKAVEIALECAWKDAEAVFLSFDIDSIDAGFVPGTGSPEPGGLLPREALKALRMVAREGGICGMEVVEIAPPYDVSDMTAQLGARAIMDVLGTLVEEGHLGYPAEARSASAVSTSGARRRRPRRGRAERRLSAVNFEFLFEPLEALDEQLTHLLDGAPLAGAPWESRSSSACGTPRTRITSWRSPRWWPRSDGDDAQGGPARGLVGARTCRR